MSRRVTAGERTGRPLATRRTASTISAGGVSLSRNPAAPARSARRTCSSASKVVRTMTSGAWRRARRASVAARPSTRACGCPSGRRRGRAGRPWAAPGCRRPPRRRPGCRGRRPASSPGRRGPAGRRRHEHADGSGSRVRGHAGQGSQAARRQPPPAVGPCSSRPSARATRSASPTSPCPGATAGWGLWTTPGPELAVGLRSPTGGPGRAGPGAARPRARGRGRRPRGGPRCPPRRPGPRPATRPGGRDLGAGGVLAGVGQGLLHDPVGGTADQLRNGGAAGLGRG